MFIKNEEMAIQIAVANYLKYKHPQALFTIAPSGMKLPIGVAKKMKAMGYRAGTPDMMIFEPRGQYNGLFLELKTKRGILSPLQQEFLSALDLRGYKTRVCYSYEQAVDEIECYLRFKLNIKP